MSGNTKTLRLYNLCFHNYAFFFQSLGFASGFFLKKIFLFEKDFLILSNKILKTRKHGKTN